MLTAQNETDYFASSEGSQVVTPHLSARLVVFAVTRADDGMDLFRAQTFEAETVEELPGQPELEAAIRELGKSLEALRKAPVTEPFDGPAILSGRAAAVFFHEVLGHRLEGQRQRGDEEGQTFTKDVGKEVLPTFLSVADDPTRTTFGDTWLSGSYEYDDEGQKARRVDLIDDGVLKTFLMSRLPIASFAESNGHGRAQTGRVPTGRQGNLIVTSTKTEPESELRKQLIEEAKKQGKAYGLYFEDISSGFAVTTRSSPQAFQVIPLVVWRVYVDGRPDELVRGVSIVGTPQAALKRILATGDKSEVFNGECGAESGTIPVSAVAPAMLVSEMETQKQAQGTARPPILPIPGASDVAHPELSQNGSDGSISKTAVSGSSVSKVGGDVSASVPLNIVEAEYSDEARRAHLEGVCLISLIVDAYGKPQNPRVVRALGKGLDEKALEAVKKYNFRPAMRDGKPVPVMLTVRVNFRLRPN
jgi:TonB family protein